MAFNVDNGSIEQITSILMSFATLIAYIFSEGFVDASSVSNEDKKTEE